MGNSQSARSQFKSIKPYPVRMVNNRIFASSLPTAIHSNYVRRGKHVTKEQLQYASNNATYVLGSAFWDLYVPRAKFRGIKEHNYKKDLRDTNLSLIHI